MLVHLIDWRMAFEFNLPACIESEEFLIKWLIQQQYLVMVDMSQSCVRRRRNEHAFCAN